MIRADHTCNAKRGGVRIFYKETLGVYRSPSQNAINSLNFLSNLSDTITNNSLFTIILGDFNTRSSVWWTNDKTTSEGTKLECPTTVHGFHQLISQPTHLLPQYSSSVDLIFTDQPNSTVDSGAHPFLHYNCHHQITYCKVNPNIRYPPPYERFVWGYNKANVESVKNLLNLLIGN